MNEKTANKKHWNVLVRKKIFLRKKFPIIDDKSVIICQQVNIFAMKFRPIVHMHNRVKKQHLAPK